MSAERGRRRRRRPFLALLLVPALAPALPARAENLLKFEVFGLRLGDSGDLVQQRHPSVFLEEVPYVDFEVGTRYEVGFGRLAVERFEGIGAAKDARGGPVSLRVLLTGDDRLFELQAVQQVAGGPIDCAAKMAELRATYGAPDVQVRRELVQWIERELGVERVLEVRCFSEGRVSWRLADQTALADHVAGLRDDLRPFIEQARFAPP